jgi:hypothetical protein
VREHVPSLPWSWTPELPPLQFLLEAMLVRGLARLWSPSFFGVAAAALALAG